jgi:NodT family efflux transporter outer membrane factor (OMF) lipoprotein
MRAGLASLVPAILLGGCVAGPDYRLPDEAVAASLAVGQPFQSAQDGAFAAAPLPDKWWRLYDEPRLDDLVEEALAANADLRVADANLERAAAIVRQTEAGRTVSTTVNGGTDLSRPSSTGYSLPGILGYDVGISAGVPLDLSGRISRAIEAAQADEDTVRAARDDARVTVAAAVTRAYAAVCAANFSLATNRRVVALQQKTLEATERLQRAGRGTAFDVTRAQAAVDQSEALLPAYVGQRQANLYLIATLLGRPPADYPRDIADCTNLPALSQPMPVGDGASLIRRRPDIRVSERRLAADTARLGVAMADLYPQVTFGGSLGISGPFKTIGSGDSFGLSLGPLLSWSFPNRPVVKARIAAAGAQTKADLASFDSTVLGALRETETALSTYARSRDRVAALQKARDSAARAAEQADRLYRFGRADFLQVLDAQRSLANAEAALANGRTQTLDYQVDIFLALGGGWQ